MNRLQIATKMISYLEKKVNCENVIKFAERYQQDVNKLIINNVSVNYEIDVYNKEFDKDRMNRKFAVFDFMTEANHTGFEHFPYIYGVLNCHNENDSKLYIYHEYFDGNLKELIQNMNHASEWYDIIFQMIMINYYFQTVNKSSYQKGEVDDHLFKKLPKPYYRQYNIEGQILDISHRYLIVIWNIDRLDDVVIDNIIPTNLVKLVEYLNDYRDRVRIFPSNRIIKLLSDVTSNFSDITNILTEYYGAKDTDV
jgi:hypothetical protein